MAGFYVSDVTVFDGAKVRRRHGVLVREGSLSQLLGVENQTQLILENASPNLVAEIGALASQKRARLVECGQPRTSLERLFLEATRAPAGSAGREAS